MAGGTYNLKVDTKVAGAAAVKQLNQNLKQVGQSAAGLPKKFKTAGNGLRYYVDAAGKARKANGQFVSSAEKAAAGIRDVGRSAQGASGGVNNFSKSLKTAFNAFAIFQGLKFVFVKTAELESQSKSLELLTGSAEKAKKVIEELQGFAAATPFTSSDLIASAKQLKAYGIETENLVDTVKRLGDVSGATGARINEVGVVFGQINAKGKLQTEELYQLQERGIDIATGLKETYKLSGEAFTDALESGLISAAMVNKEIERLTNKGGKYFQGATAQATTLAGKFSTLVDRVETLARSIGQALEPVAKDLLDQLIGILKTVTDFVGLLQKLNPKLLEIAGSAALMAGKVFLVVQALKGITALKIAIAATFKATATGIAASGTAAQIANPFLLKTKALLLSLARIGFIVVGVEIITRGLGKLQRAEALYRRMEQSGTEGFGSDLGGSALSKQEIDEQLKQNSEETARRQTELESVRFPGLTDQDDLARNALAQLETRRAKLESMREKAIYDTPADRAKADAERNREPYKEGDIVGDDPTTNKAKKDAEERDRLREKEKKDAESLAQQQQEAYEQIRQQLLRNFDLADEKDEFDKRLLQNQFDYEDQIKQIGDTVATDKQQELLFYADQRKAQKDSIVLEEKRAKLAKEAADAYNAQPVVALFKQWQEELADTGAKVARLAQTIASELGNAMSRAITGLIDGTQTVAEVFGEMFKNIGQAFISMAAEMIAKALVMKALGIFLPGAGGGGGLNGGGSFFKSGLGWGGFGGGNNFGGFRAAGGPVAAGQTYVVGERGPELFTAETSGNILPNNAFAAAAAAMGGGAGSVAAGGGADAADGMDSAYAANATTINNTRERFERSSSESRYIEAMTAAQAQPIDIRLEETVINEQRFTTPEQTMEAMQQATKQAQAAVFSNLKNRPATRRMVGI